MVMPSDDGTIVLSWSGTSHDVYADVDLSNSHTEHSVVGDDEILASESYDLNGNEEHWHEFSKETETWVKTRN